MRYRYLRFLVAIVACLCQHMSGLQAVVQECDFFLSRHYKFMIKEELQYIGVHLVRSVHFMQNTAKHPRHFTICFGMYLSDM